jgi:HEAT repeat protein
VKKDNDMTRLMHRMMLVLLLAMALPALAGADAEALVKRMPTQSHVDSDAICAELLAGGAQALDSVYGMIKPTTAEDMPARFTAAALVHYSARPGADDERRAVADALVRATGAATNDTIRAFMIEQLQWVGNDTHAAAIAPHLQNERLCSDTLRTIRLTGGDTIEALLMKAVTTASPACQTLIVKALGDIASDAVVTPALELLKRDNAEAQDAALYAIARTGDPRQLAVMQTAKATQPDTYLIYLARMVEQGHAAEAATESQALLADPELRSAYRSKALGTLVSAQGNKALPTLSDLLITEDPALRQTAVRLLTARQGAEVDNALLTRLKSAEGKALAPWLRVLAKRGAEQAREPAVIALAHPEGEVQLAAVDALAMLGGDASVTPLLSTAGAGGGAAKAAARALVRLDGEHVDKALADALADASLATQLAAVQALASRGAREHMPALWPLLKQPDSGLRKTTLKSMEYLASPADRERILAFAVEVSAINGGERSAAVRTAYIVTKGMTESPERMAPIEAAIRAGDDVLKKALIVLLPSLGGPAALQIMVDSSSGTSSETVRTAATRSLTAWTDPAAVTPLLAVAANDKVEAHRILALRGIARLLAMGKGSVAKRVAQYEAAIELTTRHEERDALMAGLAKIGMGTVALASYRSFPIDTGPVTIRDFFGAGQDLDATIVDGHSQYASPTYSSLNAFDGKPSTTWETRTARGANLWMDLSLTNSNPEGVVVDGFTWDNPINIGSYVITIKIITSTDATFGNADDATHGPFNVDGPGPVTHAIGPQQAKFVRFRSVTTAENQFPGAAEIGLTGPSRGTAVVKPAAVPAVKPAATLPATLGEEGFVPLCNGKDLTGWQGNIEGTPVADGVITARHGYVFTQKQYTNFIMKFEFKLTPGANNGIAIRWSGGGIPSAVGYELQVLDNTAAKYARLKASQYHGSIYGMSPAKRGFLKPVGEWNEETIIAKDYVITIILNGETIVDAADVSAFKRPKSGYIGFCGHGDEVMYRNLRIKQIHK